MIRMLCAFLIAAASAPAFQSRGEAEDKDVYAIFSLMLTNPHTSHGADNNERYLVPEITAPGNPSRPCVHPPKEREAELREVLADFENRKDTPRRLERKLELQKPYILLKDEDVKKFQHSRMNVGLNEPPESDERFRGVVDLFTLTDVYFNPKRTLALTAISSWCGGLCAQYQWKVFEKLEGKWEDIHWGCLPVLSDNRVWDTDGHVEDTNRFVRDRGGDLGRANAATAAP